LSYYYYYYRLLRQNGSQYTFTYNHRNTKTHKIEEHSKAAQKYKTTLFKLQKTDMK